ncbi:Sugar kinase of the NBD/HSP70 family, may contain an N-terminal HTH domain [Paenibacillus tianmuensis]|uniref:Sugar kinase of the NBD/HSP70 family, may contain an N-terminal HTH domain n=1 Tax=Paenibacillus tianmuensis TaxID=624147 RepID=A0A1G4PQ33_9BACL|nr:ROK family transcriptional regulator [Paenibacillus tianmuensis]SCW34400.1 Sugar kinase of the NBD/HSP70 family, may contain an N-terminal HTH domain [Paenibacillus tianmuensis]
MSDLSGKPEVLKKINTAMVLNLIRKQGPISRADISKALNISRPTVSKLTADLLSDGEIVEIGEGESKGGKKPILLKLNSNNAYVVGIHLSHPVTKIALANNAGEILVREDMNTDSIENITDDLSEIIQKCFQFAGLQVNQISSIAIGISGMANPDTGEILHARFISGLKGLHLKKNLESKFKVPVFIDNDVYMGLIGQESFLENKPSSMAFVTIGELVGLGMMIEGKVYRGGRYAAGEIGDMLINASQQLSNGFQADGGYLERWLEWNKIEPILLENDSDDIEKSQIVSQYRFMIACCLSNIICLYDPERIFIGGKILKSNHLPAIQELLHQINPRAPLLETTYYKGDTELMGSLYMAIQILHKNLTINENLF